MTMLWSRGRVVSSAITLFFTDSAIAGEKFVIQEARRVSLLVYSSNKILVCYCFAYKFRENSWLQYSWQRISNQLSWKFMITIFLAENIESACILSGLLLSAFINLWIFMHTLVQNNYILWMRMRMWIMKLNTGVNHENESGCACECESWKWMQM